MVIGLRSALREVRLIFSPNTVISVFVVESRYPTQVVRSVAGFFILYLSIWAGAHYSAKRCRSRSHNKRHGIGGHDRQYRPRLARSWSNP